MFQRILLALVRGGNGKLLILILAVAVAVFIYRKFSTKETEVIGHDVLVEKIGAMGKMEFARFTVKDVIKGQVIREWWPDSKVQFEAVGEAAGCIDLSKVKASDVKRSGDSIIIFLPKPEICYVKVDREKSKVYAVSGARLRAETAQIPEGAFTVAEKELNEEALKMGIIEEAAKNANIILKSPLENMAGRKVGLRIKKRAVN